MRTEMQYTVKQLAKIAGVSARTLHYYDEIGLLKPSRNPGNGYRLYSRRSLLRLQQILFLRELGLSLEEVQAVLDRPDFDMIHMLEQHRQNLQAQQERINGLLRTVERTLQYLKGSIEMEDKEMFTEFSEEKQKQYDEQVRQRYGADNPHVKESQRRWKNYTAAQKEQIKQEGNALYRDLIAAMAFGPSSPQAQQGVARWHQHLRYFYEPEKEVLLGLGDLYNDDPEFAATFENMQPGLNEFLREAIRLYVENL